MLTPASIHRFVDKQKRLLRNTYDGSWQRGVDSYEPDPNPPTEPTLPYSMAKTGATGAALLAARRRYNYTAPVRPDPIRRTVALAPGFRGINRMQLQLANLMTGATGATLSDWIAANAYRLDNGDAVAWAGEQAGYAEAADADGQFLYSWLSEGDTRVCGDCELLTGFPPMALGDWPTSPGAGDTECLYGCRCSWDTWGVPLPASYVPALTAIQSDLIGTLADRQAQVLADMMPDVAYLD